MLPGWIGEALAGRGGCLAGAEFARAGAETGLDAEGLALALLPEVAARAHAPVSGYAVGAA